MAEVAGIYCRLSVARYGDTTKVKDQERICRALAAERGWAVPDGFVFTDNNASAWRKDRKRPEWDRMVALVREGVLRNLVNYHGDRLMRQPWDLELLLKFADELGVVIASPTGEYRLDVASDRFVLRILTAKACLESDDISRRKKAGFARMKLAGRPPVPGGQGGRAFGYEKDGVTPVPAEKEAAGEAAERICAGDSQAGICRDLAARGITSTTGQPLTYGTLRSILLRPRTAGLLSDGTPGNWEPLITPDQQRRIRNVLAARRAKSGAAPVTTNAHRHLLSGIALCGECSVPLQITTAGVTSRRAAGYGCLEPGCYRIRRNATHLDAYVTGRVVRALNSVDFTEEVRRIQGDGSHVKELAEWDRRLAAAQRNLNETTVDDLPETVRQLRDLVRDTKRRRDAVWARSVSQRRQTLADYVGITVEQFKALPLRDQRTIVSAAYTIRVNKATRRGPGFNPADIDMRLRDD